jgi:hypothetical protein
LPTLELRRAYTDLIFVFKIVKGLTPLKFSDFFNFAYERVRGRETLTLKSNYVPINNSVESFFAHRASKLWNNLPIDIRTSKSLDSFKLSLYKLDESNVIQNSLIRS